MSRGLPNQLPWSNSKYALSSQQPNLDQTLTPSFLYGDFDNVIDGWDDPNDGTLFFDLEMDPAELHAAQSISPGASIDSARISNEQGDSFPLDDYMNDEPLFQSPPSLPETSDIPPRDRLCSTFLPWERIGNPLPFAPLSSEEESRLLRIAMPMQPRPITPPLSPSPEPEDTRKSQKRKSSESSEFDSSTLLSSGHISPQRTTHNMIEKRYRTNLNHKIAALRDSIPTLRVLDKDNSCSEDSPEDLERLSPVKKLNKATILSTAVEYIAHLEKRNKYLTKENQTLIFRMDAFEML